MSSQRNSKPSLEKRAYKHKKEERVIFERWQQTNLYRFNPNTSKPIFTIDTPPPYTNASWHIGGAIHYSQIDMIARTMRMQGYEVHFPMGLDRNGLPIEIQTERENKLKMQDTDREVFLQLCKNLLNKYGDQILDLAYRLGLSNNSFKWEEVYKTDEAQYRALTQATFIDLYKKGLIYEDDKPTNWDSQLQTTVADSEIEYRDGKHTIYDIELSVKELDEYFTISTSRPELLPAIGLVIFHPEDNRYKKYEGKNAKIPIWNIEVPILAHPSADPEFGRGIMMVCSFGDISDIRIFRDMNLKPTYVINPDGRLNDKAGKSYTSLSIKKGRETIVGDLKKLGKIKAEQTIPHRFPISARSHSSLEFIGMPELYLKQEAYIEILRSYSDKLTFLPENAKQIWLDWLEKITMDWPITRRRYYGTEVPLWYCESCESVILPEPGPYYQPWKDSPPVNHCPSCNGNKFRGDIRIFDTWMDSSISAYYISKYPYNKPISEAFTNALLSRPYISDLRPQGKDIVRTWLHYSMLRGHLLFNKPMFNKTWISGHVVTESGEKMSKSKGNSVNPSIIIDTYGGDALRFFGALEASHGSDMRFSEKKLAGTAKFLNKLYNIARFISMFKLPRDFNLSDLEYTDQWILSELNSTIKNSLVGYEQYDFHLPARELYKFTWELFASTYLELVKKRAYNENNDFSSKESISAHWTLYYCLDAILRLFAPIIPFITDYIYFQLFDKSVHSELFPQQISVSDNITEFLTNQIQELNTLIGRIKDSADPPKRRRDPVTALILPDTLLPLKKDIKAFHNVKTILDEKNYDTNGKVLSETKILNKFKKLKLKTGLDVFIEM